MRMSRTTLAIWLIGLSMAVIAGLCSGARAQEAATQGIVNGGFEMQDEKGQPQGWVFPSVVAQAGYRLSLESKQPVAGKRCALLDATTAVLRENMFGNVMQSIDAAPFRGKRVRFRAAVRTGELEGDGRAQLWFRIDRAGPGGQTVIGAFDNMDDRPIRDGKWKHYDIVGQVDADAVRMYVGLLVLGKGKAWLDDATLEVVSDDTPATGAALAQAPNAADAPPQPFLVPWLGLAASAIVLFVLSQTKPGRVQRFALRFSFAYWLLYSLPAPFTSLMFRWGYRISQAYQPVVDKAVRWTAARVLGIQQQLVAPNGSGDTTFDYVRLFLCFVLAGAIAALWSLIDRRKTDYRLLNDLLRSYLRYVLAFTMLGYGLAKVGSMYNQFPAPEIDQLLKPYGESSPMNLVWTFMGSSRAYTFFSGLGEALAALLLIWRRTALLGALVAAGVMLNVVMLNFCYDVPVKQYSSHLLAMALYLMLAEAPRLAGLLYIQREAPPSDLRPPYVGPKSVWVHRALKACIVIVGVGLPLFNAASQELKGAEGVAASPDYFGSYDVESFSRDGLAVPPLLTDGTRWRSVTIRRMPWGMGNGPTDRLLVRMMDQSIVGAGFSMSPDQRTLTVSGGAALPGTLTIHPVDDRHMLVSGTMAGHPIEARLRRLTREDFLLVRRGFHWINEYPYNR